VPTYSTEKPKNLQTGNHAGFRGAIPAQTQKINARAASILTTKTQKAHNNNNNNNSNDDAMMPMATINNISRKFDAREES
jgi:hypothetical protein